MVEKADIIGRVCAALSTGQASLASQIAKTEYPFQASERAGRKYSEYEKTRIFIRDGFVDRYSGKRLIYPGTLRLLSLLMPVEFPAHQNWKMSESHIVYWELFPTIDHVNPDSRGGCNDDTNWVTTSMLRNNAKSAWTCEELEWELLPPGNFEEWDGLIHWFLDYLCASPIHLQNSYINKWHRVASRALANNLDSARFSSE